MSATNYYQPHVSIDGRRLSEAAALYGLTAIADISIKWGGTDWWSNIEPSECHLVLLDPVGELLTLREGAQVVVTADPDDRVLFRGTLDASQATYTHVINQHGTRIPVWQVEVEAFDPLQALQTDRRHGPIYPQRNGQVNRLHWGRSLIHERLADLSVRSLAPIDFVYESWHKAADEATPENADIYPVAPYTTQQNVSVLTVLRNTARLLHPNYRPYFDHASGSIKLVRPSSGASSHQLIADGPVRILRNGTISITELDGSRLDADSNTIRLDLKPQDSVNFMRLLQRHEVLRPADTAAGIYGTHYEVQDAYGSTVSIGGDSESTAELDTDLAQYSEAYWRQDEQGIGLAGDLMWSTRGYRAVPSFSFTLHRDGPQDYPDWWLYDQILFRAAPATTGERFRAFTIINTPLQWGGTLPYFSIVGGRLRYTDADGWIVTCNPATIRTYNSVDQTLASATVGFDVPISNTRDELTVGDFQLL